MTRSEHIPKNLKRPGHNQQTAGRGESLLPGENTFLHNRTLLLIIILIITFIAFLPSLSNQFIKTWDDNVYVTDNPLITHLNWQSIKGFFTEQRNGTYVPLPLLSWALEFKLFGLNPFYYHLDNLLLHLLCTSLVFYFFISMRLPLTYAAFGALLFGIHPMRVESVAWVTERKDLLFGLFYLGSLITYREFILQKKRKSVYFSLTLLLFVFSLFSKIQAVTLPFSLLLVDYWLERPLRGKLLLEKIPFFFLSLLFGLSGYVYLQHSGGIDIHDPYPLSQRILFGLYSLSAYIVRFIAPFRLSAFYPYPVSPGVALPVLYYLNPVVLLGIAYLVLVTMRKTRAVVFGALFFLVNVMFLLQFVRAGNAYQADRFTYIPYLGLFFIIAWAASRLATRNRTVQMIMKVTAVLFTVFFFCGTYARCKDWKDSMTLWDHVIRNYDNAQLAYENRGVACCEIGQWENAIAAFSRAIMIDTAYAKAFYDRGVAYGNLEQWDKSVADYSKTIGIDPNYAEAYSNRGNAYAKSGQWTEAIEDFSKAIGLTPDDAPDYYNRGNAYSNLTLWDKALDDYTTAIRIDGGFAKAWSNRGSVYGNLGQWEKAIADFSRAIEIDPGFTRARANRDMAYRKLLYEKNR